jgi:microcystin degradation protein MlrC
MRVFTAALMTESCTFSPFPTTFDDFFSGDWVDISAAILAGFRDVVEAEGHQIVEGLCAGALPAGRTEADAYAALKAKLLADLEDAGPVDAVILGLHGAMAAVGQDDCEGDILTAIRRQVGTGVAIGVELDLHAHLSAAMLEAADILVTFKEWPHVDTVERARDVARLTLRCAAGEIKPRMSVQDCRLIGFYHTMEEPMMSLVNELYDIEREHRALSASVVHGYPYGDVQDMGTKILVITDDDPEGGAKLALDLGQKLFEMRGQTSARHAQIAEVLAAIPTAPHGPVLVADTADAVLAGAPGDSTFLLRALTDRHEWRSAFCYIWDPETVARAFEVGIGQPITVAIGGRNGVNSGIPVVLTAKVAGLFPHATVESMGGIPAKPGNVAVLRAGHLDIVLSTSRVAALNANHLTAFGLDPADYRVIAVKSVNNFRAGFEAVASKFLYLAGPGALDSSFLSIDYQSVGRPKWPIDPDVSAPVGP